jgi:F-type H+-transporting ATPase subunit delta
MAEITTIARPYAEALTRLAGETNAWSKWSGVLSLSAEVIAEPQVAGLIGNPGIDTARVVEIIRAICGDRLDAEAVNFIELLAENKRLAVLPEIARQFEVIKTAQEGILSAHVTSAFELTGVQLSGLMARLETKFGRKIYVTQEVDSALIGGVVIQVGDEVLDASVRGKLGDLAATLKA